MSALLRLEQQLKRFLKIPVGFAYYLASPAGVFRGTRIFSLPRREGRNTSSPKNACGEATYYSFFLYSYGFETTITFIHSRSSLENHARFLTKMGKVYTRFQTKRVRKLYPYQEYHLPPLPIPRHQGNPLKGLAPALLRPGSAKSFHSQAGN